MITNFDIYSDIYADSELRLFFHEEYENNIPSEHIWAIALYEHPKSKFADYDAKTRAQLISKDYLGDPEFDFEQYPNTSKKIVDFLTKPERSLRRWNKKLEERDILLEENPYTMENFEELDKMMRASYPMWKEYREILKEFTKEKEQKTHGSVEESASEKGLI